VSNGTTQPKWDAKLSQRGLQNSAKVGSKTLQVSNRKNSTRKLAPLNLGRLDVRRSTLDVRQKKRKGSGKALKKKNKHQTIIFYNFIF
jgi:hypothetical protein